MAYLERLVCPVHGETTEYIIRVQDVIRCGERIKLISENVGFAAQYAPIDFIGYGVCGQPLSLSSQIDKHD